nr:hypothetical protein [bacterium]
MLSKLLKYDGKALKRVLLPIQGGIIAMGLMIALLVIPLKSMGHAENSVLATAINLMLPLLIGLCALVLYAAVIGCFILVIARFYQSLIGGEAALSHTLPVTVDQHLGSKIITAFLWGALTVAAAIVALFLVLCTAAAPAGSVVSFAFVGEIFRFLAQFAPVWQGAYTLALCEGIAFILIAAFTGLMTYYLALVIGGVMAKKHKLLAGIGSLFVINLIMQVLSSTLYIVCALAFAADIKRYDALVNGAQVVMALQPMAIIFLLLYAGLGVAFYFITRYLLKNKLNL